MFRKYFSETALHFFRFYVKMKPKIIKGGDCVKRLSALLAAAVILMTSVFCAGSLDIKLYSQKISVDNNRLFDVSVCVKSGSVLTAGTFTLSYDSSAVAFRRAYSDTEFIKVRSVDSGKRVKVIFLCTGGIRVKKKSELFKVRFKSVAPGSTEIKISASDIVNGKAENISPPASVKCTVSVSGKSAAGKTGGRRYGRYRRRYSRRAYSKRGSRYYSRSGSSAESDDDEDVFAAFSRKNKSNPWLIPTLSVGVIGAAAVVGAIVIKNEKSKK